MQALVKPEKLLPSYNKKGEITALYLDYRTGEWVEIIPQYLLDMIVERYIKHSERTRSVLSLGWGVQSTRLVFGAALGEIDIDFAVHSDTTYETESTYAYAKTGAVWLLERGFPVITVKDPVSTSNPLKTESQVHIPAYNISGKPGHKKKIGHLRRQCTGRWKIEATRRAISSVMAYLGLRKTAGIIQTILGISKDEYTRASSADDKFVTNCFPLLRQDFDFITGVSAKLLPKVESRDDCVAWLIAHGFKVPKKSACFHCAYHKQSVWVEMKIENGSDWKNAVAFDEAIRNKSTKYGQLFIHRSATPLIEAVKTPAELGYSQSIMLVENEPGCDSAGYCEFVPSK